MHFPGYWVHKVFDWDFAAQQYSRKFICPAGHCAQGGWASCNLYFDSLNNLSAVCAVGDGDQDDCSLSYTTRMS